LKLYLYNLYIAYQTKSIVINATTKIAKKKDKPQDQVMTITNNIQVENNEFFIWNSFDTTTSKLKTQGSNTSKGIIEVNRYVDEDLLLRTGDPLKWWKEYGYNYPNLSLLAREKCCTMATSVPYERVFSKTGFVFNERRNRLKPSKVNFILFLNHYYKLL